jgi:hypothetical protein
MIERHQKPNYVLEAVAPKPDEAYKRDHRFNDSMACGSGTRGSHGVTFWFSRSDAGIAG